MFRLQAVAALLISTGLLVACGGAAGPVKSSFPAQPATQIESPQLLVWNSAVGGAAAELYAYRIDSSGALNLLPGFPLQGSISVPGVVVDPAARVLFIRNGSASLDSYLLTASGPELKTSVPPQTAILSDGSAVSAPPTPIAVWPPAHELIGFYPGDGLGVYGDFQRFRYDASGNLTALDQPQPGTIPPPAPVNYFPWNKPISSVDYFPFSSLINMKALPASGLLAAMGGYTGHTCGDSWALDTWAVAGDGSLQFVSPGTYLGDDCSTPAYPSDIAISASGAVVVAYGGVSDVTGFGFGEFHTLRIGSDGTANPVSVVPVPSLAGDYFHLAIDEADRLVFVVATAPGSSAETLLWYGFDPVTGIMSQEPLGSIPGVNTGTMTMVGKYLVANAPLGVLTTYAITANGPQQFSQQQLRLPSTTIVPVQ